MSRVFVDDDGVWRGLSTDALADFERLAGATFFAMPRSSAATSSAPNASTARRPARRAGPRRFATIASTCCRTRTSGRSRCCGTPRCLQLALTRDALAEKLITKDASAYNVQFVGTKPVFIDIGSFERLRNGEPWPGYRQFCELFLNPLHIQALRDVPFQPLLRGSIHGISPTLTAEVLRAQDGSRRACSPTSSCTPGPSASTPTPTAIATSRPS